MTTPPPVGIHYGVPAEVYHSWDALSNSQLSRLRQSPAHLLDLLEGDKDEFTSTPAQVFGTAVHCIVLEPEEYYNRYAIRPEGVSGVTKEGKAFAAQSAAEGKIVLSDEQHRWCMAVSRRVLENKRLAQWGQLDHQTEVSFVWLRDGYTCRARADLVIPSLHIIADLKTTLTGSPEGFQRQIAKYHYHTQGAWYTEGMREITGEDWTFWLIAAEKRRPFLVSLYELVRGSAAHGAALNECDRLFHQYKTCCETRTWPGYPDATEIELPEWALMEGATGEEEDVIL